MAGEARNTKQYQITPMKYASHFTGQAKIRNSKQIDPPQADLKH